MEHLKHYLIIVKKVQVFTIEMRFTLSNNRTIETVIEMRRAAELNQKTTKQNKKPKEINTVLIAEFAG